MMDTILVGDAWQLAKTLPDQSVHCIVTSPPYWALRDYGTAQWDGGDPGCAHRVGNQANQTKDMASSRKELFSSGVRPGTDTAHCARCGARRIDAQFGLEATPEEFVARLVALFAELRRVLRDDGTLWLNLGDSYAGSGGAGDWSKRKAGKQEYAGPRSNNANRFAMQIGIKPKNLVGIPWRVAFALQADGWNLRADLIWHKPNPMPESVTDRPTRAHEYMFLLSKSERYWYDADAVRERSAPSSIDRAQYNGGTPSPKNLQGVSDGVYRGPMSTAKAYGQGRNCRSVWTIPTSPYKGAHFATFPPALVEPCILAGCPVGGVVLDPFMGSGTVASVAIRLGRQYVGFELNPAYAELARERIAATQRPLFAGIG